LLEAPKYKLLTYNAAKNIQNETAPNIPQSKITVSNFHNKGAIFVFKQRKSLSHVRKSEHRFRTALLRYEWHWYEYEPYDTIRIPDSLDFVNFEVLTISRLTCRTETKEQRKYGKELKTKTSGRESMVGESICETCGILSRW